MENPKHGINTRLVHLKLAEMRKLLKPRQGFLAHAAPLIALYAHKEADLRVHGVTPDDMREALAGFQELLAREADSAALTDRLRSTRLLYGSKLYGWMLDVYARAKSAARHDVEVARAIDGFERFLQHKVAPVVPTPTQAGTI